MAATPTTITVSANSMPRDAVAAIAARRRKRHSFSARATSTHTTRQANASAVYCFRSSRTSIAGDSSAAAPVSSPVANRVRCSSRPKRYPAAAARAANASGTSRSRWAPPKGTSRSRNVHPTGVLEDIDHVSPAGARTESATHASSTQKE